VGGGEALTLLRVDLSKSASPVRQAFRQHRIPQEVIVKVLVFVKATANSEAGVKQGPEVAKMFEEMGKFNEKLVKAGVMKEADGLKPSSFGKRLKFSSGGLTQVVDGPFAETKELVAGYWVWEVKSVEEAVEWAKQCPNPMPGEEGVLEIRPTYSIDDFDDIATDSIRERNQRLQNEMDRQKKPKAKARAKAKAKKPPARKAKPARAKSKK
jgi:hypothetical protein